ncbi:MAG: outer membrane beta-barrel protein [Vicingaceae bacterium]|nr:outer membrane beta-barrel protein [Vicingaceae bacterium]
MKFILYIFIFLVCLPNLFSQEKVTTFGIQLKPIVPVEFFNAGKQEKTTNNIQYINEPKFGMSFGMVIRRGLTKNLSLETGLNFLRRNYDLTINDPDSSYQSISDFSIVNYEIPLLLLVYVQLGRNTFMNVAGGASIDVYPSDLFVGGENFSNTIIKRGWIQPSMLANLGWEYRTEKSGYVYLGVSLHRPFNNIFTEFIDYERSAGGSVEGESFDLTGSYFTIDLRYFFHEEEQEKRVKTKKINRKKAMRKIREGKAK